MINRSELVSLLNSWLEPNKFKDHTFNGLQFEGTELIKHFACAVDISLETLKKAAEINADFLLTHHGIIWGGINKIESFDKKRLEVLFQHNINVYCSHLPLDHHKILGNNTIIIDLLGLVQTEEIFFEVGYFAEYTESLSYSEFIIRIKQKISDTIIEMPFGNQKIKRVAVCSGGATLNLNSLFEAHTQGADTILSGETNSLLYHYAKELNMNIVCAGHYATEVFGIQAVMKKVQNEYKNKMKYSFIDLPTGF